MSKRGSMFAFISVLIVAVFALYLIVKSDAPRPILGIFAMPKAKAYG